MPHLKKIVGYCGEVESIINNFKKRVIWKAKISRSKPKISWKSEG